MLTHAQFQRELQKRSIEPNVAYMLAHIYEALIEMNKQVDTSAEVTLGLANTLADFVKLSGLTESRLGKLEKLRGTKDASVDSMSVLDDPMQEH